MYKNPDYATAESIIFQLNDKTSVVVIKSWTVDSTSIHVSRKQYIKHTYVSLIPSNRYENKYVRLLHTTKEAMQE